MVLWNKPSASQVTDESSFAISLTNGRVVFTKRTVQAWTFHPTMRGSSGSATLWRPFVSLEGWVTANQAVQRSFILWWNSLFHDDRAPSTRHEGSLNGLTGMKRCQLPDLNSVQHQWAILDWLSTPTPNEGISFERMVFCPSTSTSETQCHEALKLFWWNMMSEHVTVTPHVGFSFVTRLQLAKLFQF